MINSYLSFNFDYKTSKLKLVAKQVDNKNNFLLNNINLKILILRHHETEKQTLWFLVFLKITYLKNSDLATFTHIAPNLLFESSLSRVKNEIVIVMTCQANQLLFKTLQIYVMSFIQGTFLLLKDTKINYYWQLKIISDGTYRKINARKSCKTKICII